MKLALMFVALCAASNAFCADVSFHVGGFRSEWKNGVRKVSIYLKDDHTASVVLDPNTCTPEGQCTAIAVARWEAPITVISDLRATDGPLILGLGRLTLIVGSGFNIEGKVDYAALVGSDRYPLSPDVYTSTR